MQKTSGLRYYIRNWFTIKYMINTLHKHAREYISVYVCLYAWAGVRWKKAPLDNSYLNYFELFLSKTAENNRCKFFNAGS